MPEFSTSTATALSIAQSLEALFGCCHDGLELVRLHSTLYNLQNSENVTGVKSLHI